MLVVPSVAIVSGRLEEPEQSEESVFEAILHTVGPAPGRRQEEGRRS